MIRILAIGLAAQALIVLQAGADPAGIVSSASPEATSAGVEILEQGGNAMDAAIAVQFALGVTEPAMSGLGGQSQIILQRPGEAPVVINGTSFAPGRLPDTVDPADLKTGWTAMTVPSTVKVMDFAHRQYGGGEIAWADLLEPAIRYAEDGFVVGNFRAKVYAHTEEALLKSPTIVPFVVMPDGHVPAKGDLMRQPVLADTLRRLATAGADDFYTGEIAGAIADDMARYGGWITRADLAATSDPRIMAPLSTSYRGVQVYTLPPPAGGWVMLLALNLLEQFPAEHLAQESPARTEALLQALQAAHRARHDLPESDLVNYESDIRARLSKAHAGSLSSAFVPPGGETTHFSVMDADGMVVSVTASIDSYFGARVASPSLGFFYNNYMQSFDLEPGRPFSLKPRGMAYSSMSSTIVTRDSNPVLVLGSPGSERIISTVAQVISHWVDVGAGIEAAVDALRVHVAVDAEDGRDNAYLEGPVEGVDLARLGLDLSTASDAYIQRDRNAYFGGVHALALETPGWVGAADPRRDGVVGYTDTRAASIGQCGFPPQNGEHAVRGDERASGVPGERLRHEPSEGICQ
ncbi:gamma-glutamyltransferase family protein [Hyphomonas johnsonii]|uniref:Gamma-glutamyltransferase n=1 Tax=Hyphomonas johnsonii MHS-2 TaxID=1280950 RepID=A0A059FBH2_9PROT|nr:gamma-glutamyltransferase [Hyphomonas johnsonii]KCZ87955.1 gamma-glutamyltransferase [Hyphomonas johnsonii MHS-2]